MNKLKLYQTSHLYAEKDIGNFVEVASSTLGEDDLAAQKTSSLLNALTGFSPLIYGLPKESSYERFIDQCKKVWVSLQENKSLNDDLVSIYL